MRLSYQLYSARNFFPLSRQIETIAELGYDAIEPYGPNYAEMDALVFARELGLAIPSGHFDLSMLETAPERVLSIADTLGMEMVVAPYLAPENRPADREGWSALGERLGTIAERFADAGLRLAWHNHDFEFARLPDGTLPINVLLAAHPAVELELDVVWAVKAGVDAAAFMEGHADRITAIHMKDIAPEGENRDEDGWADVGMGTIAWSTLWPHVLGTRASIAVMEHDNPNDFSRFGENSARVFRALG